MKFLDQISNLFLISVGFSVTGFLLFIFSYMIFRPIEHTNFAHYLDRMFSFALQFLACFCLRPVFTTERIMKFEVALFLTETATG